MFKKATSIGMGVVLVLSLMGAVAQDDGNPLDKLGQRILKQVCQRMKIKICSPEEADKSLCAKFKTCKAARDAVEDFKANVKSFLKEKFDRAWQRIRGTKVDPKSLDNKSPPEEPAAEDVKPGDPGYVEAVNSGEGLPTDPPGETTGTRPPGQLTDELVALGDAGDAARATEEAALKPLFDTESEAAKTGVRLAWEKAWGVSARAFELLKVGARFVGELLPIIDAIMLIWTAYDIGKAYWDYWHNVERELNLPNAWSVDEFKSVLNGSAGSDQGSPGTYHGADCPKDQLLGVLSDPRSKVSTQLYLDFLTGVHVSMGPDAIVPPTVDSMLKDSDLAVNYWNDVYNYAKNSSHYQKCFGKDTEPLASLRVAIDNAKQLTDDHQPDGLTASRFLADLAASRGTRYPYHPYAGQLQDISLNDITHYLSAYAHDPVPIPHEVVKDPYDGREAMSYTTETKQPLVDFALPAITHQSDPGRYDSVAYTELVKTLADTHNANHLQPYYQLYELGRQMQATKEADKATKDHPGDPVPSGSGVVEPDVEKMLASAVKDCKCSVPTVDTMISTVPSADQPAIDDTTAYAMLSAVDDVLGGNDNNRIRDEGNAGVAQMLPSQFTVAGTTIIHDGQGLLTDEDSQNAAAAEALKQDLIRHNGNVEGAFSDYVRDNRLPPYNGSWRTDSPMSRPTGQDDLLLTKDGKVAAMPTALLLTTVTAQYKGWISGADSSSDSGTPTSGPTDNPTHGPTATPTPPLSGTPTPTATPTPRPTSTPTPQPSGTPTPPPTSTPTPKPPGTPTPPPTYAPMRLLKDVPPPTDTPTPTPVATLPPEDNNATDPTPTDGGDPGGGDSSVADVGDLVTTFNMIDIPGGHTLFVPLPPANDESFFAAAAKESGVPEQLLYAVAAQVSNFDPNATGLSDHHGVMQLTPDAFQKYANSLHFDNPDIADPEQSIRAGAAYLHDILGGHKYRPQDGDSDVTLLENVQLLNNVDPSWFYSEGAPLQTQSDAIKSSPAGQYVVAFIKAAPVIEYMGLAGSGLTDTQFAAVMTDGVLAPAPSYTAWISQGRPYGSNPKGGGGGGGGGPFSVNTNLLLPSGENAALIDEFLHAHADPTLWGLGQTFMNAESQYHVSARYLVAHAMLESGWGTSDYSRNRHNLYGWSAYTADPDKAHRFDSYEQCIDEVAAAVLWDYLTPPDAPAPLPEQPILAPHSHGTYYVSPTLAGMNVHYATDMTWASKIAFIANEISSAGGVPDCPLNGEYSPNRCIHAFSVVAPAFPFVPKPSDPADPASGGFPNRFWAFYGQCTYWAAYNSSTVRDTPAISGNAGQWIDQARAGGATVTSTPAYGDVVVWRSTPGYYGDVGHVAVVIAVDSDNSGYWVSEMNYHAAGGGDGIVDIRHVAWPDPYALGFIPQPTS